MQTHTRLTKQTRTQTRTHRETPCTEIPKARGEDRLAPIYAWSQLKNCLCIPPRDKNHFRCCTALMIEVGMFELLIIQVGMLCPTMTSVAWPPLENAQNILCNNGNY